MMFIIECNRPIQWKLGKFRATFKKKYFGYIWWVYFAITWIDMDINEFVDIMKIDFIDHGIGKGNRVIADNQYYKVTLIDSATSFPVKPVNWFMKIWIKLKFFLSKKGYKTIKMKSKEYVAFPNARVKKVLVTIETGD